jgi:hypothetical protein
MLAKAVKQYPKQITVVVHDASDKLKYPYYEHDCELNYVHRPGLGLADSRNAGTDLLVELGKKYILHVDDDTFFRKPERDLTLLARMLSKHKKLWVVGGMGLYSASWRKKTQGHDGPFYATWATGGFGHMTRATNEIRCVFDRREDLQMSLDAWVQGGRVALDTRCIVNHLDSKTGGTEEPWEEKKMAWYPKYIPILQERYGDVPFITISKNGVASIRFKRLGITNRAFGGKVS